MNIDTDNITKSDRNKFFRQRLCNILVLLSIVTFSNFSFCQSISTVSEIYNYNINDIFHVHEFGSSVGHGFSTYSNIQITNKYYSTNSDTVFYTCFIKTATSTSDNPSWVYDSFTDNIFYTNLDSLIFDGNIDTVYYGTMYNGRKINFVYDTSGYITSQNTFIDGCGGSYYYYTNAETSVLHYLSLLYFLKGSEEWGEPYYVSIDEKSISNHNFTIYPNPTQDKIYIDCYNSNFSNGITNGILSSTDGRVIKKFSFQTDKSFAVDLSCVSKGIYFVLLESDKKFYNYKLIKE